MMVAIRNFSRTIFYREENIEIHQQHYMNHFYGFTLYTYLSNGGFNNVRRKYIPVKRKTNTLIQEY